MLDDAVWMFLLGFLVYDWLRLMLMLEAELKAQQEIPATHVVGWHEDLVWYKKNKHFKRVKKSKLLVHVGWENRQNQTRKNDTKEPGVEGNVDQLKPQKNKQLWVGFTEGIMVFL